MEVTPLHFELPDRSPPVEVSVRQEVLEELHKSWKPEFDTTTFIQILLKFPPFKGWLEMLEGELKLQSEDGHPFHDKPYALKSITVQSVDWWGGVKDNNPKGFVKLKALVENEDGKRLPGVAFLRGGSVAVLMILRSREDLDERWVVMTMQPRIPAGSLRFLEIPAGMIDGEKKLAGKAVDEIREETGLTICTDDLRNMTELALASTVHNTNLMNGMYPSPGGSDEYIPLLLWEKTMDRADIMNLKDKLTGQRWLDEMITLKIVRYEDLWKEGARDAKTLAAWALYEGYPASFTIQHTKAQKALYFLEPVTRQRVRGHTVDFFHRPEFSHASLHLLTQSTISSNQVVARSRMSWRQGKTLGRNQRPAVRLAFKGEKPIAIGVVDREDVATDATGTVLRYLRRSGSEVPPLDPTKVLSEKVNSPKFLL